MGYKRSKVRTNDAVGCKVCRRGKRVHNGQMKQTREIRIKERTQNATSECVIKIVRKVKRK